MRLLDLARTREGLIECPSRETLRALTLAMPNARVTRYGNLSVQTRAQGWSCDSTFLVAERPELSSHRAVSRREAAQLAALQDRYLAAHEGIALDGVIGGDMGCRLRLRLYVERSRANIAAVQEMLYFASADAEEAEATVVCTPGLRVPGFPDGRVVTIDLDRSVTRVCGSDFAGEPKRAGLRMWSKRVWERGGLPLHAAVSATRGAPGAQRIALLVGRPGTGKSTLLFADATDGIACQEDRVAWMRDGSLVPAERAFFSPARLAAEGSRLIRGAIREPSSHLENVPQHGDLLDIKEAPGGPVGRVVFGDGGVAQGVISGQRPALVILLVRNQNVVPAVARLDRDAAAAIYVAALDAQRVEGNGALQALGANPLLPLSAVAQGARLLELLYAHDTETYVLNTGRVGGPSERDGSRDIEPRHSAAIVAALLAGKVDWEHEISLGCDVAVRVPGLDPRDDDVLRPLGLYRRAGRVDEYAALARGLTQRWSECAAHLGDFSASLGA